MANDFVAPETNLQELRIEAPQYEFLDQPTETKTRSVITIDISTGEEIYNIAI